MGPSPCGPAHYPAGPAGPCPLNRKNNPFLAISRPTRCPPVLKTLAVSAVESAKPTPPPPFTPSSPPPPPHACLDWKCFPDADPGANDRSRHRRRRRRRLMMEPSDTPAPAGADGASKVDPPARLSPSSPTSLCHSLAHSLLRLICFSCCSKDLPLSIQSLVLIYEFESCAFMDVDWVLAEVLKFTTFGNFGIDHSFL